MAPHQINCECTLPIKLIGGKCHEASVYVLQNIWLDFKAINVKHNKQYYQYINIISQLARKYFSEA